MTLDEIKRRRAETREERDKKLNDAAAEVKKRKTEAVKKKVAEKTKQTKGPKNVNKNVEKPKVQRGGKR